MRDVNLLTKFQSVLSPHPPTELHELSEIGSPSEFVHHKPRQDKVTGRGICKSAVTAFVYIHQIHDGYSFLFY
jgi:hypothetical protein